MTVLVMGYIQRGGVVFRELMIHGTLVAIVLTVLKNLNVRIKIAVSKIRITHTLAGHIVFSDQIAILTPVL
jgi:hypothetical protein